MLIKREMGTVSFRRAGAFIDTTCGFSHIFHNSAGVKDNYTLSQPPLDLFDYRVRL